MYSLERGLSCEAIAKRGGGANWDYKGIVDGLTFPVRGFCLSDCSLSY